MVVLDMSIPAKDLPEIFPGVKGYTVDKGEKGLYVPAISAIKEGSGQVGKYIDWLKDNYDLVKFPTIINYKMAGMLQRRGFRMKIEWSKDHGEVEVWAYKK